MTVLCCMPLWATCVPQSSHVPASLTALPLAHPTLPLPLPLLLHHAQPWDPSQPPQVVSTDHIILDSGRCGFSLQVCLRPFRAGPCHQSACAVIMCRNCQVHVSAAFSPVPRRPPTPTPCHLCPLHPHSPPSLLTRRPTPSMCASCSARRPQPPGPMRPLPRLLAPCRLCSRWRQAQGLGGYLASFLLAHTCPPAQLLTLSIPMMSCPHSQITVHKSAVHNAGGGNAWAASTAPREVGMGRGGWGRWSGFCVVGWV